MHLLTVGLTKHLPKIAILKYSLEVSANTATEPGVTTKVLI